LSKLTRSRLTRW